MIVGSFPKLHALLKHDTTTFTEIARRNGLIVVDEAHRVIAPTHKAVTKALMGQETRVVGLTATPGRGALCVGQNQALAQFFFDKIVHIDNNDGDDIGFLRKKKVLAETDYDPLLTSGKYVLDARERRHLEKFLDFPPGFLSRLAQDDVRNVEIVKRLEAVSKNGAQTVFFACSVEHSKFICALLNFLGISAAHVDGETDRARRQRVLSDFKSSKVSVICNYGLLSTGFDAPKTDVVFISRPTGSIVLFSQMIGRGLRGPAIGGKERCKIIVVKDNITGFSNESAVYDYFTDYYVSN